MTSSLSHKFIRNNQIIYIPTYISAVFKRISNIDHQKKTADADLTLIIRFLVEGLNEDIVEQLSSNFNLQLNSRILEIKQDDRKVVFRSVNEKDNARLIFTYRGNVTIDYKPGRIHWNPFDHIVLSLEIEVIDKIIAFKDIKENPFIHYKHVYNCNGPNDAEIKLEPNLPLRLCFHTHQPLEVKNSEKPLLNRAQSSIIPQLLTRKETIKEEKKTVIRRLPFKNKIEIDDFEIMYDPPLEFDSISSKMQEIKAGEKQKKIELGTTLSFSIYAQRNPTNIIFKYITPIIVLQFLLLAILAQDDDLGGKIGNIATLLLAIFAFLPSLKTEIPNVSSTTITEKVIYFAIYIGGLILFDAVVLNYGYYSWFRKLILVVSSICVASSILIILIPYIQNRIKRIAHSHCFVLSESTGTKSGDVLDKNEWFSDAKEKKTDDKKTPK